jgi:hypothetical protein
LVGCERRREDGMEGFLLKNEGILMKLINVWPIILAKLAALYSFRL